MIIRILIACSLLITSVVFGQYASRFPVPIPLFHKSPYLSAFLPANASIYNQGDTARLIPVAYFIDWIIAVRVDGTAYLLQGELQPNYVPAKTIGAYITSTRTILTMDAGPLRVNITYLTPIELDDWILHSLPFVYFSINVQSTDGNPHSIQLYSDVGGTFLSSNRDNKMTWGTTITSKSIYHQAQQSQVQTLVENNEMAEDGTQYFATNNTPGTTLTWQSATYSIARGNFSLTGKLANTSDQDFRSISNGWTSMAFALDFGSATEFSNPPVFSLGLVRDPVMRYVKDGTQSRSSLWWSRWGNVKQAIDALFVNYPAALSRAIALDNKIVSDATATLSSIGLPSEVAMNLTDLMILSLRQTIGSLEFTTVRSSKGQLAGMNKWRVFMKDFGTGTGRVNPVDNIYASFPAFLYIDPSLAGKLLEPLLEFQSDNTSDIYAAPDLGRNWPIVTGNNTEFYLGVESCGSMLVMALAHARKSGDGRLIATYYDLLRKWADFLVTNSLIVNAYTTTADWANGTSNLALKGILGIYAMGQINKALGRDPTYYLDTAKIYVQNWQSRALASDHVMAQFGNATSWGLLFNLYDARLLGATIIPQTIYETQASWYASQIPKAPRFGLPYDSSQPGLIKAPWTLFTAASVINSTNSSARDALIGMVHARSFMSTTDLQLEVNPSTYFADTGGIYSGIGNPAMGGTFAFLALNAPDLPINFPPPSSSLRSTYAIVGGVVGGLAALTLLSISAYFLFRRKFRKDIVHRPHVDEVSPMETSVSTNIPEVIPASPAIPRSNSPPPYTNHAPLNREILLAPNPTSNFSGVMNGDFGNSTQNGVKLFTQNALPEADNSTNTPTLSLSAPGASSPYPIPRGLGQLEDAELFNTLHGLNVPAADIATMVQALQAGREAASTNANRTLGSGSGAIRVGPDVVNTTPPRYDFKDSI